MRRSTVLASAVVLAVVVVGVFAGALAAQTSPPEAIAACAPDKESIVAADLPAGAQDAPERRVVSLERCPVGDRLIVDGVVKTVLPAPGHSVYAEALWSDDGAEDLSVKRSESGVVTLEGVGDESRAPQGGAPATGGDFTTMEYGACNDDYYDPNYYKWRDTFVFKIHFTSVPLGDISYDTAETEIRQGVRNITLANNDCGYGDGITATASYGESTYLAPDISVSADCLGTDGTSSIGFGDLPGDDVGTFVLGYACTYAGPLGGAYESDHKYNKKDANYTAYPNSSSCNNEFGLAALATHEFGHTFGLGHAAPETDHWALTMSPGLEGPCFSIEETLGKGDILGLALKY